MAQIPIKRYRSSSPKALQIIFTSSTTYTIDSKWKSMDVFMVNGGNSGIGGWSVNGSAGSAGGAGGGGGYTKTETLIDTTTNKLINVEVGKGGAQGVGSYGTRSSLTLGGITYQPQAQGQGPGIGSVSDGGSGGGGSSGRNTRYQPWVNGGNGGSDGGNGGSGMGGFSGTGQGTTTRAFEESTGELYAGGGGGGASILTAVDYAGLGAGGARGGGDGGGFSAGIGQAGGNNTGGGGGGGGGLYSGNNTQFSNGGAGGSGIVIIRLYKDSDRPEIEWNNSNTITIDGT